MIRNRKKLIGFALSLCALAGSVFSQTPPPREPTPLRPKAPKVDIYAPPDAKSFPGFPEKDGLTTEKSIPVDPNVSIKVCVAEGDLKINGWERDEVRIFVKDGSKFGVKILEKSADSGKPNWIHIKRAADQAAPGAQIRECISGQAIEMDVPMKASLTVEGRVTRTTVDSVRKIYIKNLEGNLSLRNIAGGITANTYQGDVTVENSGGAISLESATGNIVAFEVSPGQIGDVFKAKTNSGTISLQKLEHRQIDANSITGSVLFNSKFLMGGLYNFKTSNGSIRLTIPSASSCTIKASYGFGRFNSEIPLKILTENETPGGSSVVASIGEGDACTVSMTTNNGSIGIKKQ
ncbi:MAG: DUF4097 family beta strand repeat protein [Saprospiraceae bacterium]|nr:DUF4097 family beta strand repeat protein [Pyrinomonadaceae bacterium]